jgi:hypothetical protein
MFVAPGPEAKSEGSAEDLSRQIQSATAAFVETMQMRKLRRKRRKKIDEKKLAEQEVSVSLQASGVDEKKLEEMKLKMEEKRKLVIEEIIETEKSYVASLNKLVTHFLTPLEESAKTDDPIVPKDVISKIFSNITGILSLNVMFCSELEKLRDNDTGIGSVFVKFASYFSSYKEYINNHEQACDVVRLLTSPSTFRGALSKVIS